MIALSVAYPKSAEKHFDWAYYVEKHIPLVSRLWTSFGLGKVQVLRGASTLDNSMPASEAIILLEFSSVEDLGRALDAHGAEIMGDVENFTDIQPKLQINEVVL